MTLARQDRFIEDLKIIQEKYPDYSHILKLLIEQIKQGKAAKIQEKLQKLRDESW